MASRCVRRSERDVVVVDFGVVAYLSFTPPHSPPQGSVSVLASLSDSTPIAASAGYDGSVIVWNCSSSSPSSTKMENRRKQLPPITAFSADSEGNLAATGSNNGLVR